VVCAAIAHPDGGPSRLCFDFEPVDEQAFELAKRGLRGWYFSAGRKIAYWCSTVSTSVFWMSQIGVRGRCRPEAAVGVV
jgi:hypothetical protein